MDIMSLINSVMMISAATVVLSEYLTKLTKAKGVWSQVQSWTVSVLLGLSCSWLGLFQGMSTMGGVMMGVLAGLASNGLFDLPVVQAILVSIGARPKKA